MLSWDRYARAFSSASAWRFLPRCSPPAEALPGTPAPEHVVAEIRPLKKPDLAEQLRVLLAVHDVVKARARIDAVRMVGEDAWIYFTGT